MVKSFWNGSKFQIESILYPWEVFNQNRNKYQLLENHIYFAAQYQISILSGAPQTATQMWENNFYVRNKSRVIQIA